MRRQAAQGADAPDDAAGALDDAKIPVGGGLWRALGANGALIVGYLILGAHVAILVGTGLWSAIGDAQSSDPSVDRLATLMFYSTVLAPLIGGSVLFIGELQRRGTVRRNARQRTDTMLPQGTNSSLWRMVTPRWNATWLVVCAASSALLLAAANDPRLGYDTALGSSNWTLWSINSLFLAGFAGQNAGTWLKKVAWARRPKADPNVSGGGDPSEHPLLAARRRAQEQGSPTARRQAFWRAYAFHWRFDVWLCVLGAIGLWSVGWFLGARHEFPGDSASLELAARIAGSAGVVMLAVGLWSVTQFWRAGEDLSDGE